MSGANLVAIATRNETKVHRGPDHHESMKDGTLRTIPAANAAKGLRRATRDPQKDHKSEAEGMGTLKIDLMRAVNLPDAEDEAVAALVNG